jgi:hypothetical protein
MKTIFSTEHVHPRERFDCWHAVACTRLMQHDSTPDCREAFRAELQAGGLDQLKLIFFENSPMRISHGVRHTARGEDDDLFICRQFAGTTALEQCGRELVLSRGDMTVLDPALPYSGSFAENSQLLVLKAPRPVLEARVGKPRELAAYRIQPHSFDRLTLAGRANKRLGEIQAAAVAAFHAASASARNERSVLRLMRCHSVLKVL